MAEIVVRKWTREELLGFRDRTYALMEELEEMLDRIEFLLGEGP